MAQPQDEPPAPPRMLRPVPREIVTAKPDQAALVAAVRAFLRARLLGRQDQRNRLSD